MIRYEAYIDKDWRELGTTEIIVARLRSDGRNEIAFFFVDVWCLGVEEAFLWEDRSPDELRDLIAEELSPERCERIHPACAKKLIEGAIAYAEALGIAPHRDYRKARRVFSDLSSANCPENFTYGRHGKPTYVKSPDHSPERVERVLALLEARCGVDGFVFEDPDLDDDDGEFDVSSSRAVLRAFFADPNNEAQAKSFFEFGGMVTAMILSRAPLPPTRLVELLWPDENDPRRDPEKVERFFTKVLGYWTYLMRSIMRVAADGSNSPDARVPDIFADDFADPADLPLVYPDWARGFTRVVEGFPADWDSVRRDPALANALSVVGAWGDAATPETNAILAKPQSGKEAGAIGIGPAVLKLVIALAPKAKS